MIKFVLLLSLASIGLSSHSMCLEKCHDIAMKRCLKKCGDKPICPKACQKKIQEPCKKRCQGMSYKKQKPLASVKMPILLIK